MSTFLVLIVFMIIGSIEQLNAHPLFLDAHPLQLLSYPRFICLIFGFAIIAYQ